MNLEDNGKVLFNSSLPKKKPRCPVAKKENVSRRIKRTNLEAEDRNSENVMPKKLCGGGKSLSDSEDEDEDVAIEYLSGDNADLFGKLLNDVVYTVTSILDHLSAVFYNMSCGGSLVGLPAKEEFNLLSKLKGSQEVLKDFRKQKENGFLISEDVFVFALSSFKEVLKAGNNHKSFCHHNKIEYLMKMSELEGRISALKELCFSPSTVGCWYREPVFARTATPSRSANPSRSTNTTPANKTTATTNTTPANKTTATNPSRATNTTPANKTAPSDKHWSVLNLKKRLRLLENERTTILESDIEHEELGSMEDENISVSEGVDCQNIENLSDLDHISLEVIPDSIKTLTIIKPVPVGGTGNVANSNFNEDEALIKIGARSVTFEGVKECQNPEHSVVNLNEVPLHHKNTNGLESCRKIEDRALKDIPLNLLHLRSSRHHRHNYWHLLLFLR